IGHDSFSRTGQVMESSTGMPLVSIFSVLNHTPPLETFMVRPTPVSAMRWPYSILYFTSWTIWTPRLLLRSWSALPLNVLSSYLSITRHRLLTAKLQRARPRLKDVFGHMDGTITPRRNSGLDLLWLCFQYLTRT